MSAKDDRLPETALAHGSCAPLPGSEKKPTAARLYEVTALVSYSVVLLATSSEDALAHVATWEHAWDSSADLIGVSDVDVLDVRDLKASDWRDEAHECTAAATKASSQNHVLGDSKKE